MLKLQTNLSFSLIPTRFQSKSLAHDPQLGKHYNGDDHEGPQEVICTMFRLVLFVSAKSELSNNYKAMFLWGQNLELLWTKGLSNFLQRWSWMLKQRLVFIYEKYGMTCGEIVEAVENLLCFASFLYGLKLFSSQKDFRHLPLLLLSPWISSFLIDVELCITVVFYFR